MRVAYYRLPAALAASISLALAACSSKPAAVAGPAASADGKPAKAAASGPADPLHTGATIWTLLGLAKETSQRNGPQLGDTVNPTLWEAAHQTLDFVHIAAQDPHTGTLITDWYSPKDKPNERLKVDVFILSGALRSTSIAVKVLRQTRSPDGEWVEASVDSKAHTDLEAAILNRARQIRHAEVIKQL